MALSVINVSPAPGVAVEWRKERVINDKTVYVQRKQTNHDGTYGVMGGMANVHDELLGAGPPLRLQRSLGLIKPGRPLVARRALLAVRIGWLPPAVLAAAYFLVSSDKSAKSFFSDYAFHAPFLVAVPALIFAEAECIPRLGKIVNHFAETGLVIGPDTARFQAAVSSTRRLRDLTIDEVITVVLAYLVVLALTRYVSMDLLPAWHRREANGLRISPGGWWHRSLRRSRKRFCDARCAVQP